MHHYIIAWILFTIPIWLLGTAYVDSKTKGRHDTASYAIAALLIFVIPFWAIYFLVV